MVHVPSPMHFQQRGHRALQPDFVELMTLIETRPGVRSGKPCLVGTRIAVYDVLDCLASGMTTEQIVADLPEISEQHVRAAIAFAALRERRLASPE